MTLLLLLFAGLPVMMFALVASKLDGENEEVVDDVDEVPAFIVTTLPVA